MAYLISGLSSLRCCIVIYGPTQNGKTVFLNKIMASQLGRSEDGSIEGQHMGVADGKAFVARPGSSNYNPETRVGVNTRIVAVSEIEVNDKNRWNTAQLKQVRSDGDAQAIEQKYKDTAYGVVTAKYVIPVNGVPYVDPSERALTEADGIRYIAFYNTFLVPGTSEEKMRTFTGITEGQNRREQNADKNWWPSDEPFFVTRDADMDRQVEALHSTPEGRAEVLSFILDGARQIFSARGLDMERLANSFHPAWRLEHQKQQHMQMRFRPFIETCVDYKHQSRRGVHPPKLTAKRLWELYLIYLENVEHNVRQPGRQGTIVPMIVRDIDALRRDQGLPAVRWMASTAREEEHYQPLSEKEQPPQAVAPRPGGGGYHSHLISQLPSTDDFPTV